MTNPQNAVDQSTGGYGQSKAIRAQQYSVLTADVEELLAAHCCAVRDLDDRDAGGPVTNLLGVGCKQGLSGRPLKVLRGQGGGREKG